MEKREPTEPRPKELSHGQVTNNHPHHGNPWADPMPSANAPGLGTRPGICLPPLIQRHRLDEPVHGGTVNKVPPPGQSLTGSLTLRPHNGLRDQRHRQRFCPARRAAPSTEAEERPRPWRHRTYRPPALRLAQSLRPDSRTRGRRVIALASPVPPPTARGNTFHIDGLNVAPLCLASGNRLSIEPSSKGTAGPRAA
jgi:hypothetical protein